MARRKSEQANQSILGAARALKSGNVSGALKDATKAVEYDPQNANAWSMLASIQMKAGRAREALLSCNEHIALKGESATILNLKTSALLKLEDYPAAIETCRASLRLEPRKLTTLKLLVSLLYKNKDYAEGVRRCEEILATHGELAWAYKMLGNFKSYLQDYPGALAAYTRLSEMDPGDKHVDKLIRVARKKVSEGAAGVELGPLDLPPLDAGPGPGESASLASPPSGTSEGAALDPLEFPPLRLDEKPRPLDFDEEK